MSATATTLSAFDVQRLAPVLGLESPHDRGPMHLQDLLLRTEICDLVAPPSVPADLVTMNSHVAVRALPDGRCFECRLVFPREANPVRQMISVLAPLGSALLGAQVGDTVEVHSPGGLRAYEILELLYQPEARGDYHL